jgi:hypothetical protein
MAKEKPLKPDDFPIEAEEKKLMTNKGKPIASTESKAIADDLAERVNEQADREEHDRFLRLLRLGESRRQSVEVLRPFRIVRNRCDSQSQSPVDHLLIIISMATSDANPRAVTAKKVRAR